MRLHNFFIDQKIGAQKEIKIDDSGLLNQWRHVLRFNTGSSLVLFDNSGLEYLAQFVELTYRGATLAILKKQKNKFLPKREIFLYQSLIKSDKFEWILEKGTELGVSHFCPVISARSVAKKINLVRAKKILIESSEQSGRGILPDIVEPVSLDSALSSLSAPAIALDPTGSPFSDFSKPSPSFEHEGSQSLNGLNPTAFGVFLGPEGGFMPEELKCFTAKNIPIVSLGSQILRAETAAIAISSLLLL